jgi:hypothetical protein
MLVIAANLSRHEPHHVCAQFAVPPRPKKQVEVIGHQTKSQETHRDALPGFIQQAEKGLEVAGFAKDRTSAIAPIKDMITISAQGIACAARHHARLAG